MKLTIKEALDKGFKVDESCYPHVGYKGARFCADEIVKVFTETEAELFEACEEAHIHLATYKIEGYSAKEVYIIKKLQQAIDNTKVKI